MRTLEAFTTNAIAIAAGQRAGGNDFYKSNQFDFVFSRVPRSIQENISLVRRAVSGSGMFTIGY